MQQRSIVFFTVHTALYKEFITSTQGISRLLLQLSRLTLWATCFALIILDALLRGMHHTTQEQMRLLYGDFYLQPQLGYTLDRESFNQLLHRLNLNNELHWHERSHAYAIMEQTCTIDGKLKKYQTPICQAWIINNQAEATPDPITRYMQKIPIEKTRKELLSIALGREQYRSLQRHCATIKPTSFKETVWLIPENNLSSIVPGANSSIDTSESVMQYHSQVTHLIASGIDELDGQALIIEKNDLSEQDQERLIPYLYGYCNTTAAITKKTVIEKLQSSITPYALLVEWEDIVPGLAQALKLELYSASIALTILWIIILIVLTTIIAFLITRQRMALITIKLWHSPLYRLWIHFLVIILRVSGPILISALCIAWIAADVITTYRIFSLPDAYYSSFIILMPHLQTVLNILFSYLGIVISISGLLASYIYTMPFITLAQDEGGV